LGNLPLIGALFRSQSDNTQRHEVIILLTPHIIKDDSVFNQESEQEQKEIEKLRVGARKELMFFGRERLAESAYEDAINELNSRHPSIDKAIWHLDCAIDLNPHFIEAIDLKERLTGKQVTDADNSSIRGFVRRMIIEDVPPPPPPPGGAALPPGILSPAPAPVAQSATRPTSMPSAAVAAAAPAAPPTTRPIRPSAQATIVAPVISADAAPRPAAPTTRPASDAKAITAIPLDEDDFDIPAGK
jgi:hypothetical protein